MVEAPEAFRETEVTQNMGDELALQEEEDQDMAYESMRHIQFNGKSIQYIIKGLKEHDPAIKEWCL